MNRISLRLLFTLVALIGGLACSSNPGAIPSAEESASIHSIELFMSRASMIDAEFEQFKLTGNRLYKECGTIRQGRHYPQMQDIDALPEDVAQAIRNQATVVASQPQNFDPLIIPGPGKSSGMFDPGILNLTIKGKESLDIKTSFDSIGDADRLSEKDVKNLVSLLRQAAGGRICDNAQFFGIK